MAEFFQDRQKDLKQSLVEEKLKAESLPNSVYVGGDYMRYLKTAEPKLYGEIMKSYKIVSEADGSIRLQETADPYSAWEVKLNNVLMGAQKKVEMRKIRQVIYGTGVGLNGITGFGTWAKVKLEETDSGYRLGSSWGSEDVAVSLKRSEETWILENTTEYTSLEAAANDAFILFKLKTSIISNRYVIGGDFVNPYVLSGQTIQKSGAIDMAEIGVGVFSYGEASTKANGQALVDYANGLHRKINVTDNPEDKEEGSSPAEVSSEKAMAKLNSKDEAPVEGEEGAAKVTQESKEESYATIREKARKNPSVYLEEKTVNGVKTYTFTAEKGSAAEMAIRLEDLFQDPAQRPSTFSSTRYGTEKQFLYKKDGDQEGWYSGTQRLAILSGDTLTVANDLVAEADRPAVTPATNESPTVASKPGETDSVQDIVQNFNELRLEQDKLEKKYAAYYEMPTIHGPLARIKTYAAKNEAKEQELIALSEESATLKLTRKMLIDDAAKFFAKQDAPVDLPTLVKQLQDPALANDISKTTAVYIAKRKEEGADYDTV